MPPQFCGGGLRDCTQIRALETGTQAAQPLDVSPLLRITLTAPLLFATACSESSPSPDAGETTLDANATASDATPSPDAEVQALDYDENGCLTSVGAGQLCGSSSDKTICNYWHDTCGQNDSVDQCVIDCENGPIIQCYSPKDVTCLQEAFAAQSLSLISACGWIL